ncbi:MAG: Hpt domain-containing protein [Anaerolineaceae bacterium]|nr:Hpt domain-containing protein [Anaerolineaceae bacterium]
MTLEELYTQMGGNYEHAKQIMKMDKLIDKYVRKLKNSEAEEKLAAAGDTMDPNALFETAHALKGVCANLGLDNLAAAAEEITEEFRPGNSRKLSDEEVKGKLLSISEMYQKTLACIEEYANS